MTFLSKPVETEAEGQRKETENFAGQNPFPIHVKNHNSVLELAIITGDEIVVARLSLSDHNKLRDQKETLE